MIRLPIALTTAALAILIASPGTALHCNGDITTINVGDETLYIDHRSDPSSGTSLWLYLESNDVDGLQSGGECIPDKPPCTTLFPTDPCPHSAPDTLLHGVVTA